MLSLPHNTELVCLLDAEICMQWYIDQLARRLYGRFLRGMVPFYWLLSTSGKSSVCFILE